MAREQKVYDDVQRAKHIFGGTAAEILKPTSSTKHKAQSEKNEVRV